jgi:ligand-binding sensor domain-containing protein
MRRMLILIGSLICGVGVGWKHWCAVPSPEPTRLYTAAGQVTAVARDADGALWAATRGGVVRWGPGADDPGMWTTRTGLTTNELRALCITEEGVWVANAQHLNLIAPTGRVGDYSGALAGKEIRCLAAAGGHLWVGTSAGLFRRDGTAFTRIAAGNICRLAIRGEEVMVFTTREVRLPDGMTLPLPEVEANLTACLWADTCYIASASGFWRLERDHWQAIPLPSGDGSHVSALAAYRGQVLVAVHGDGVYQWHNDRWRRRAGDEAALRQVAVLWAGGEELIAGTQHDGVWRGRGAVWHAAAMPAALPSADIYGLAQYRGKVWASTFDAGLLCRDGKRWRVFTTCDGLSSDSPREMVVFRGRLYLRHTTGELDCYDGWRWRRAFNARELPRPAVYALATDGRRLYLGGWAGWSATDGRTWERHFHDGALQGQVVTAIAAGLGAVWVGTQQRGIVAYRRGTITPYHEAQGLTDDWITRLAIRGDRLLVGTYTGGLLEWTGQGFRQVMTPRDFAIRDIALPAGSAEAFIATPLGVYRESGDEWRLLAPTRYGGLESQVLCAAPQGLWIGSRTALAYLAGEAL